MLAAMRTIVDSALAWRNRQAPRRGARPGIHEIIDATAHFKGIADVAAIHAAADHEGADGLADDEMIDWLVAKFEPITACAKS